MRNFHAYCLVWLYWSYAHEAGFATISQKCLWKHCVVIESGYICLNLDYLIYILPWSSYFYLLKTEFACMHAQLLQPCLPLCDPMDCSLTGFFVYGILQARILEWVAMPSFREDWVYLCISTVVIKEHSSEDSAKV